MATEAPPANDAPPRTSAVRIANIGLLTCALALSTWYVVSNWNLLWFRATGKVTVDGSTFYLQPRDNFLTQLVVRFGEYEPTETEFIRRALKEGDVFIDVGANVGWYTVHAAKAVGETGQVIAFEPEPGNLALLERNVRVNHLKNVVTEGLGLSNAPGSFKLYLEENNLGMHSLVEEHGGKHYIDVKTVRFDDYWKGKGPIKLVKIDTEGAEGMILDGMRETLKEQKGMELVIEFSPKRLKKSGYDADKVLSDLYQLGYKASLIDESNRRVVFLGTPSVKDLGLVEVENGPTPPSLHFKR